MGARLAEALVCGKRLFRDELSGDHLLVDNFCEGMNAFLCGVKVVGLEKLAGLLAGEMQLPHLQDETLKGVLMNEAEGDGNDVCFFPAELLEKGVRLFESCGGRNLLAA